jgi:hypothetical protein
VKIKMVAQKSQKHKKHSRSANQNKAYLEAPQNLPEKIFSSEELEFTEENKTAVKQQSIPEVRSKDSESDGRVNSSNRSSLIPETNTEKQNNEMPPLIETWLSPPDSLSDNNSEGAEKSRKFQLNIKLNRDYDSNPSQQACLANNCEAQSSKYVNSVALGHYSTIDSRACQRNNRKKFKSFGFARKIAQTPSVIVEVKKDNLISGRPESKLSVNDEGDAEVQYQSFHSTNTNNKNHRWIVDSGASTHMCHDSGKFQKFVSAKLGMIRIADGSSIPIEGSGTISVHVNNGTDTYQLVLKDVAFVPNLDTNLISVQ